MYAPEKVVEVEKVVEIRSQNENNQYLEGSTKQKQNEITTTKEYEPIGGLYFLNINDGLIYFSKKDTPEIDDYVLIKLADPDTFEVYEDSPLYARDRNKVYFLTSDDYFAAYPEYALKIISGADPETFQVNIVKDFPVSQGNGHQSLLTKDKNNVYYGDKLFKLADPESFVITDYVSINYDKNYVFLWRKIIPSADPQTYEVVFDTSWGARGVVFGRDANQCFKDYELFDCEMMPTNWDEAYALSEQF